MSHDNFMGSRPRSSLNRISSADETYGSVMESYIIAPFCESPIEIRFGSRLSESLRQMADVILNMGYAILPQNSDFSFPRQFLVLHPQFCLGKFRYDFAIHISTEEMPESLIECDGKAFHSTPEQRKNDNRKDDLAAEIGIKLFRFSGSEIYRQVDWCVAQTLVPLFKRRFPKGAKYP